MRFHELHGKNISFDEQRLVATRFNSFTHAMIFSERPLYPGELFIIEIEDSTDRWTGHIKIGFTLLPPNEILNQCKEEVVYDHTLHIPVPDRPVTQCACTCGLYRSLFNIGSDDEYIHTPFASILRQSIEPVRTSIDLHPTSVGSRIGVVYAFKQKSIHMHCIFNGFDYGPFSILKIESSSPSSSSSSSEENEEILYPPKKRQRTCWIPNQFINEHTKFWAFVDVYGATKRVRILQLYGPSSLKSLCRSTILSNLKSYDHTNEIFLCNRLKSYLKFYII